MSSVVFGVSTSLGTDGIEGSAWATLNPLKVFVTDYESLVIRKYRSSQDKLTKKNSYCSVEIVYENKNSTWNKMQSDRKITRYMKSKDDNDQLRRGLNNLIKQALGDEYKSVTDLAETLNLFPRP